MASQTLQGEIRKIGGECYDKKCLRFGFEVKTDEDANQIYAFYQRYSDALELDPESTETMIIFRIRGTELSQIPKELTGMIFGYLPEQELATRFVGDKELEGAKQYAIEHREAIETNVKLIPGFNEWLGTHRHLKSLKLSIKLDEEKPPSNLYLLTDLLGVIKQLDDLETLRFSNLPFGWVEDITTLFAETLGNLPLLATLEIPGRDLDDNAMEILAPIINQLTHLTSLDISGNRLTAKGLTLLVPTFERLTHLNVESGGDNESWAKVFPLMKNVTRLTHVNFYANQIEAETLVGFLSHLPNLVDLNLGENDIDDAGFQRLLPVFQTLTKIENLDLIGSGLSYTEFLNLIDLYGSYPNLKTFTLAHDLRKYGRSNYPEIFRRFAAMFARTQHLEKLDILEIDTTQDFVDILAPAILQLPLKELVLSPVNVPLEQFLNRLTNLQSLTICPLHGTTRYSSIFESLKRLTSLETLIFEEVKLSADEVSQLAALLKVLPNLHHLEIQFSTLDAVELFRQTGPLPGLTHLILRYLRSDEHTFDQFVPLLTKFPNLEVLEMEEPSASSIDLVETLVRSLPQLTMLNILYSGDVNELKEVLFKMNPEI